MIEPITVVINNRNLLHWTKAMVECIEKFHNLHEIIIIDNDSDYPPLMEWYKTFPHKIISTSNLGHTSVWQLEINKLIETDWYVFTDPDLDLTGVPADCLVHLQRLLKEYPRFYKIGLSLDIEPVVKGSPYYDHVQSMERRYWTMPLVDGKIIPAPIDTTFAIYCKRIANQYFIGGGRAAPPYMAKHIPWSLEEKPEDFEYYLKTANKSCSYKWFMENKDATH